LDLLFVKAFDTIFDTGSLKPRHNSRPVTTKTLNNIGGCPSILLRLDDVFALLLEKRRLLGAEALVGFVFGRTRFAPWDHNKIPNEAILGKERLHLTCSPQWLIVLVPAGLLLVRLGHMQLHRLEVLSEPSRTGQALPAIDDPQAPDSVGRTPLRRLRDSNIFRSHQTVAAKEFRETLELRPT
jgi:hypothetical protein